MSRKYKTEMRECVTLDSVTCNGCGELARDEYGNGLSVDYRGGYGSVLGDMTDYQIDLCEKCLAKIVGGFKVPAEVVEE